MTLKRKTRIQANGDRGTATAGYGYQGSSSRVPLR